MNMRFTTVLCKLYAYRALNKFIGACFFFFCFLFFLANRRVNQGSVSSNYGSGTQVGTASQYGGSEGRFNTSIGSGGRNSGANVELVVLTSPKYRLGGVIVCRMTAIFGVMSVEWDRCSNIGGSGFQVYYFRVSRCNTKRKMGGCFRSVARQNYERFICIWIHTG